MAISDRPTLAEMHARPHATPKHALPTRADRLREKRRADREDERQLLAWALAVKHLDGWKDRYTGKPVRRTFVLDLDSAHAHHIAPRSDYAVRYDIRNGITLSFETHERVERGELRIVGTKFFVKHGKRYINGRHQVRFEVVP